MLRLDSGAGKRAVPLHFRSAVALGAMRATRGEGKQQGAVSGMGWMGQGNDRSGTAARQAIAPLPSRRCCAPNTATRRATRRPARATQEQWREAAMH